jgi:hypothetical protein
VSFVTVPPALARELQHDSPFPEVLALNAAARRARGTYIGRIDQDTLVGERFLRWFFEPREGRDTTLLFANRRSIPYRFAALCPPMPIVDRFLRQFGSRLHIETGRVFYRIDVGIWLLHRDVWRACGGYDERMIYMNDMEIDMVHRLVSAYPLVDLGKLVDYDFYHLDHYHPRALRASSTYRKVNGGSPQEARGMQPSGDGWGLAAYSLEVRPVAEDGPKTVAHRPTRATKLDAPIFALIVVYTSVRVIVDRIIYPFYPRWRRRAVIAWETVRGRSPVRWPALLRKIWIDRPSARERSVGTARNP